MLYPFSKSLIHDNNKITLIRNPLSKAAQPFALFVQFVFKKIRSIRVIRVRKIPITRGTKTLFVV